MGKPLAEVSGSLKVIQPDLTDGFDDSMIYDELSAPIQLRKIPINQLLHKEALQVFKAWQEKDDKIRY